ncbi:response regulator [Paraburkholderia sp. CNPSo 3076]|uniref:response regulator n=1 Tax=Paraburkholderia sp. CNPSo 3076 TaxID=2940936 RepID=UPI00225AF839|nr:response regulator [Paraburkholderia sp. CNPSo 3076]MCX5541316.1 response regulator [Paraburkholderia sp. CNPSo 3076]
MTTRDADPLMNPAPVVSTDPATLIALLNEDLSASRSLHEPTHAIAFVDLDMPGIDGCQFAQRVRVRADWRDLRLVALTGWAQAGDALRSAQAGFDRHLVNPIGLDQLTAALTLVRER